MQSELDQMLAESFWDDSGIKYINYKGHCFLETYESIADSVENFEVHDDDIWVCSFPKTGTTWAQEMVWNIANDLDFERAKIPIVQRFPFLEIEGISRTVGVPVKNSEVVKLPRHIAKSVEYTANLPKPRFIKTHLPFHLLPRQLLSGEKKCKIIYIARNPKDTCISFYHHYKSLEGYRSSFENFCKLFLGNKVCYAPFWEHVAGYWKINDKNNILCLKYEDMKADLPSVIRKTADFLGKNLKVDQIATLANHLNFSSMKVNPSVNKEQLREMINENKVFGKDFVAEGDSMRKGIVGQWKEEMTKEFVKEFDDWTADKLKIFPHLLDEFKVNE